MMNLISSPMRTPATLMLSKSAWGKSLALDWFHLTPGMKLFWSLAAIAQKIISHLISCTYHAFKAKPLKAQRSGQLKNYVNL